MDFRDRMVAILESEPNYYARFVALAMTDSPDMQDRTRFDEEEFLQIFSECLSAVAREFDWTDYLTRRQSFVGIFQRIMRAHRFPEELLQDATADAVVVYFQYIIDQQLTLLEQEDGITELPELPEGDLNNIFMADLFAILPDKAEDRAFCDSIGVNYDYEQLHMVSWFSSQVTRGGGHYSRSQPNFSSRVTYNRLLNANSLLWIAAVLGVDREALRKAAAETATKRTGAAACGIVRRYAPFDAVVACAVRMQQQMLAEAEQAGGPAASGAED